MLRRGEFVIEYTLGIDDWDRFMTDPVYRKVVYRHTLDRIEAETEAQIWAMKEDTDAAG